jgi:hypothetical protein
MKQITLNIGGQDRTFYFGLGFLGNLLEKENLTLQELGIKITENPYKWSPLIMHYSLAWGCEREGKTIDVTPLDVSDWLDEVGLKSDVVTAFDTALIASLTKDVPAQEEGKKKVTKK